MCLQSCNRLRQWKRVWYVDLLSVQTRTCAKGCLPALCECMLPCLICAQRLMGLDHAAGTTDMLEPSSYGNFGSGRGRGRGDRGRMGGRRGGRMGGRGRGDFDYGGRGEDRELACMCALMHTHIYTHLHTVTQSHSHTITGTHAQARTHTRTAAHPTTHASAHTVTQRCT